MRSEHFLEQLAKICHRSATLPWSQALGETLELFASAVGVERALLLLMAQGPVPAHCLATGSSLPAGTAEALSETLQAQPLPEGAGLLAWQIPGWSEPAWLLPVPLHTPITAAILVFIGPSTDFPIPLLEQGAALITPLVQSAQLRRQLERLAMEPAPEPRYARPLNDVITIINQTLDLDEILRVGLSSAMQVADMERGAIYLWDERDACLRLRAHHGMSAEAAQRVSRYRAGEGAIGKAYAEQRETLEWNLVTAGPGLTMELLRSASVQINLPLPLEGQAIGVMSLTRAAGQELTPDRERILRTIADQLALAIQRGQLTTQLQIQLRALHDLYEISAAFLSQMGTRETIFILLRTMLTVLKDAAGSAFYQHEHGVWTRARVYVKRGEEAVAALWQEGPIWTGEAALLDQCYQTGVPQSINGLNTPDDPCWDQARAAGGQQLLYLPLALPHGDAFGVVAILLQTAYPLSPQEFMLAQALLQQSAVTLTRIRLYEASYEAETRLQAILDSSQEGIILVGEDFRVRYVNRQALELLALAGDPTAWETRSFAEVITAIRWEARELARWLHQASRHIPLTQQPPPNSQGAMFETAHSRILVLRDWPVYSERQHPLGRLFVLRDITEQKSLERMRDDLLHMIVHDMRNPLSVILSALQALQDDFAAQADAPRILDIALENTERLLTLVTAILSIGKLEQGQLELHQHPCQLPVLIERLGENLQLTNKRPTLRLNLPPDLPLVWADVTIVERIFQNLMDNALKFIPMEKGLIEITVTADQSWVTVEVYNNGDPIPPEAKKELFEKFKTSPYRGQGYGLGLFFCRLAVEAHGGRIWADNCPQGGVAFYFTLPTITAEGGAVDQEQRPEL